MDDVVIGGRKGEEVDVESTTFSEYGIRIAYHASANKTNYAMYTQQPFKQTHDHQQTTNFLDKITILSAKQYCYRDFEICGCGYNYAIL